MSKLKTLAELSEQELKKLLENNEKFRDVCYNEAYSMSMWQQEEEAKYINTSVFDYNDHYDSFYLSTPMKYGIASPESVAGKLVKDYLNIENADLYDELCKLIEEYEKLDYDEQQESKGQKLHDKAIEVCDKLADGITQQLRAYENIDDDYVWEELKYYVYDSEFMSDWKTDGTKVYQTITKVYE